MNVKRGHLRMCVCQSCGFVWNRAFDAEELAYGPQYENTQDCSPYFSEYLDGLARSLVEERGVKRCTVVEVGCGKGTFLRRLVLFPGSENIGLGFDPSYTGPEEEMNGRLRFRREYFDATSVACQADAVVSRHVIEHVADPISFLSGIRAALADSPTSRVFLETPCVEWILRGSVFWDFFYEHCSLFSVESLSAACRIAGFSVTDASHVFGGQYLWFELSPAAPSISPWDAGAIPMLAAEFAVADRAMRDQWLARLRSLATKGRVAVWGAGAKGTTFVNLLDPKREAVSVLIDLNPAKQGKFVPGTGHEIVGVSQLRERGITLAILMNPNYLDENRLLLERADASVELIA